MNNIGIDVNAPKKECKDLHCPFHGGLKVRGRLMTAKVIASKVSKTATVERSRRQYLQKFQRFERRRSRIRVHNPECIDAKEGDYVTIMESRPISKTKRFVIIQINNVKENKQ